MHSFMNKYLLSVYLRRHNSEQARPSFNEAESPVGEMAPDQDRIICFSSRCVFEQIVRAWLEILGPVQERRERFRFAVVSRCQARVCRESPQYV